MKGNHTPQILILVCFMLLGCEHQAGRDDGERQRRIEAENELRIERHTNNGLMIAVSALGITSVVLLVVGAAIGSKARKEVSQDE